MDSHHVKKKKKEEQEDVTDIEPEMENWTSSSSNLLERKPHSYDFLQVCDC